MHWISEARWSNNSASREPTSAKDVVPTCASDFSRWTATATTTTTVTTTRTTTTGKKAKIAKELPDRKKKSQNMGTMRNTCVRYALLAFHEGVR